MFLSLVSDVAVRVDPPLTRLVITHTTAIPDLRL
jgi:hypothetical protein